MSGVVWASAGRELLDPAEVRDRGVPGGEIEGEGSDELQRAGEPAGVARVPAEDRAPPGPGRLARGRGVGGLVELREGGGGEKDRSREIDPVHAGGLEPDGTGGGGRQGEDRAEQEEEGADREAGADPPVEAAGLPEPAAGRRQRRAFRRGQALAVAARFPERERAVAPADAAARDEGPGAGGVAGRERRRGAQWWNPEASAGASGSLTGCRSRCAIARWKSPSRLAARSRLTPCRTRMRWTARASQLAGRA